MGGWGFDVGHGGEVDEVDGGGGVFDGFLGVEVAGCWLAVSVNKLMFVRTD